VTKKTSAYGEDMFTIADVTIQKTIESIFKEFYPYMTIVGEEDVNSELYRNLETCVNPENINKGLISHKLLRNSYKLRKERFN
jgi:3'-phosphoadenosine 5'-phosphosulfate (PAPS) 3'-phosphatase